MEEIQGEQVGIGLEIIKLFGYLFAPHIAVILASIWINLGVCYKRVHKIFLLLNIID